MLGRIVELAEDDRYVSVYRGFLIVREGSVERGRVALDDIGAVIGNAYGLVYSNNALIALAERGVPLVLCGANHRPVAMLWPLENRFQQAGRIQAQANARRPLKKRIWQAVVQRKLQDQSSVLEACGRPYQVLRRLATRVRSGDPENLEAQGARHYWRLLFGESFRRDPDAAGINALLDYGYAVLRACAARGVVAAGLHPSLGVFHRSAENAFQLVDDVMEAYRPIVDAAVYGLVACGQLEVNKYTKRQLARLMYRDWITSDGRTPLVRCIEITALSIARAFCEQTDTIEFPGRSDAEVFRNVIREIGDESDVRVPADVDDSDV